MLDLFTARYPYTDYHELNLDWLVSKVIAMNVKLDNFVSLNTIKYADPIGWDITKQYEANTVVLDQNTGIAYLSSQPVPSGVSLSNTDYWSVIFDLQQIIGNINENLTYNNDNTSPTCTIVLHPGDWVLWRGKLYKVLVDMLPGYAYVEGSNIEAHSVEELVKELITAIYVKIGNINDLTTSDKTSIVNAINSLLSDITTAIGDLSSLTTTDKSSIVNAINEVLSTINTMVGDLSDLATSDNSDIVHAINSVLTDLSGTIGDLVDLDTTDKSSIVNAINEIYNETLNTGIYFNVEHYGAVGDGVTDDTQAIQDAFTACRNNGGGVIFFPYKQNGYIITQTLNLDSNMFMLGEGMTPLKFNVNGPAVECHGVKGGISDIFISQAHNTGYGIHLRTADGICWRWRFNHLHIEGCVNSIYSDGGGTIYYIVDCIFNDITIERTKGKGLFIPRSRGFITLRNVKVDQTLNTSACPWTSFDFGDFIGLEFEECDALGPVSTYVTPAYNANQIGFRLIGADDGKSSVWFRRCLVDTTYGQGFAITKCNYLMGDEMEAFGNLGSGITLNNVFDAELNKIYCAQATNAEHASGATGLAIVGCTDVTANNVICREHTGVGISVSSSYHTTITGAISTYNDIGYYCSGNGYNLLSSSQVYRSGTTHISQDGSYNHLFGVYAGNEFIADANGTVVKPA